LFCQKTKKGLKTANIDQYTLHTAFYRLLVNSEYHRKCSLLFDRIPWWERN